MLKIIKKSLIILLLITIDTIVLISKSIYKIYEKYKTNIERIAKSFYTVLKEEISQ